MAESLQFEFVSPERLIMSGAVMSVTAPGTEGQFGVLAGHAPVMTNLRPGMVDIEHENGTHERVFIRGGFAEVNERGLIVLAEQTIREEDLNVEALDQQIKNSQEDVTDAVDNNARQKAQECLCHLQEMRDALSN